jgi:hypothetical protein
MNISVDCTDRCRTNPPRVELRLLELRPPRFNALVSSAGAIEPRVSKLEMRIILPRTTQRKMDLRGKISFFTSV